MTVLLRRQPGLRVGSLRLRQAIIEALAYSDVFDYPLRLAELHRYLPLRVALDELQAALDRGVECVASEKGFYFLDGREQLTLLRLRREFISRRALQRAVRFGRMLGSLPFIRMVALTGSLAMLNSEADADMDYMLVAAPGRVWTARGFALLFGRLVTRNAHTLCPNLIVSELALEWPDRDLYGAHEICQMMPIFGKQVYDRLRRINDWTGRFLPNAEGVPLLTEVPLRQPSPLQSIVEWPLHGALGERLETWEMNRKIQRLTHQVGFGIETRFTAEVCQGNFQHHGAQTRQAVHERLAQLESDSSVLGPFANSD